MRAIVTGFEPPQRRGKYIARQAVPNGRSQAAITGHDIVFELIGDLYTLPLAGGTATRITSGLMFDSQPRYSPDGSKIVFLSDRSGDENIWIADRDGTNARPLTKGKHTRYWSPEWTPDGKYIIAKLETDKAPGIAARFQIDGIPTLLIFKRAAA